MTAYDDPTTWRLTTGAGAIPYRILGIEGDFGPEAASATMTLLVASSQLLAFVEEMFPAPVFFGGYFPVYPACGRIYGTPLQATHIKWRGHVDGKPVDPFGIDPAAPAGTYQPNCLVTVDFSTSKRDNNSSGGNAESDPNDPFTFLEISCSGAGEFIHSTAPKAKWVADGNAIAITGETNKLQSTPVSLLVPEVEWDVSWPRLPYQWYTGTLVSRLRASLGKVNSLPMTVLFNAPPETILFVGYTIRQSFTWRSATQPPFNLNLKFLEKHVVDTTTVVGQSTIRGHNDFWKADVGWQRLLYDGTNPVYGSADINWLFTV